MRYMRSVKIVIQECLVCKKFKEVDYRYLNFNGIKTRVKVFICKDCYSNCKISLSTDLANPDQSREWTYPEIEYLKANHLEPKKQLAKDLCRTLKSVREKLKELGEEKLEQEYEDKKGWTDRELEILSDPNLSNKDCVRLTGRKYHTIRVKRHRMKVESVSSYNSKKLSNLKLVVKDHCPKCNNNALFYNEETGLYLCTLCKTESYWYELN